MKDLKDIFKKYQYPDTLNEKSICLFQFVYFMWSIWGNCSNPIKWHKVMKNALKIKFNQSKTKFKQNFSDLGKPQSKYLSIS